MTMVVKQPYPLVSKLKKTKTKCLCCTGNLNSIKRPYRAKCVAYSSSCTTIELSKLLTSRLTAVKNMLLCTVKRYMRNLSTTSPHDLIKDKLIDLIEKKTPSIEKSLLTLHVTTETHFHFGKNKKIPCMVLSKCI